MSLGEIFSKAAMNTLLGMGTVFAVLILISFIISLFKFIGPRKSKAAAAAVKTEAVPEPAQETAEEDEIDDYELVAVITAAIAAAAGSSTDGFVVKSIKRANNSKWRRA